MLYTKRLIYYKSNTLHCGADVQSNELKIVQGG